MKIYINQTFTFEAIAGLSILESAREASLTINHSCLNGRCSECKVKVVEGTFDMPISQESLSTKDIQDGYCLSCITKPTSDLILEEVDFFEGNLPESKTIPVKISSIEQLSNEVIKIKLRTPPNKELKFIPGQYLDLTRKGIKRSYSIASLPGDSFVELIIKRYPNGEFSNYLFNEASINDLLRLEGPKGTYILPEKIANRIVFVSTGTGIAPNLSIIKSALLNRKIDSSKIIIVHGQRYVNEHIYSLEETLPGVKIIKTTSREVSELYFHGYVQDAIKSLNLDMADLMVFACGNPQMVKNLKTIMIKDGLNERNFKSDIFIPSN